MAGESEAKFAKKDSNQNHHHLRHIPEDIIISILVRLPVKSLLRFRSVSKHWLSLISSPRFTQRQLDLAKDPTSLNHERRVIFQKYPSRQIRSIGYRSLDLVNHTCPVLDSFWTTEVLASCDGLLLVGVGCTNHFLWNPSTRRYIRVEGDIDLSGYLVRLYGLGYDSSSNAYKVIRIVRPFYSKNTYDDADVLVYNCTTRIWRSITDDFPYELFTNGQGIVVNGAPHWVVSSKNSRQSETNDGPSGNMTVREHVIIWFDLREEMFKEVPKPNWLVKGCSFELGSLRGLLCLAHHGEGVTKIWVMEEYGVKESWTSLFIVPKEHVDKFAPLCLRENNEVLLEETKHKLNLYNLSDGNVHEILRYRNPGKKNVFKSATYVESLVSPPGMD